MAAQLLPEIVKTRAKRASQMIHQLTACTSLGENLSFVSSTHVLWFTVSCNSSSRGSNPSPGLLRQEACMGDHQAYMKVHTNIQVLTCVPKWYKNKSFSFQPFKEYGLGRWLVCWMKYLSQKSKDQSFWCCAPSYMLNSAPISPGLSSRGKKSIPGTSY